MVSNARLDLPEPESPVTTISLSRGISSETFLRLCTRAPCTAIVVRGAASLRVDLEAKRFRGVGLTSPSLSSRVLVVQRAGYQVQSVAPKVQPAAGSPATSDALR